MAINQWDAAWTADTLINGDVLAAAAVLAGDNVSNTGKDATEVAIQAANAAGTTLGLIAYICRKTPTGFESRTVAWAVSLPATPSTTFDRVLSVPGSIAEFRIEVENPTGNAGSITATVQRRQSTTS